jgi:hypothetical protein
LQGQWNDAARLVLTGLEAVELLMNRDFPGQNRGFCFLEFYNHNCADEALRTLTAPNFK